MRLTTLFLLFAFATFAQKTSYSVLVYTKNGPGYVHENISSAVAAIQKLGAEKRFNVEVTDNTAVFE
jgi:hypothetical protein